MTYILEHLNPASHSNTRWAERRRSRDACEAQWKKPQRPERPIRPIQSRSITCPGAALPMFLVAPPTLDVFFTARLLGAVETFGCSLDDA